jgi:hypothetical protein
MNSLLGDSDIQAPTGSHPSDPRPTVIGKILAEIVNPATAGFE